MAGLIKSVFFSFDVVYKVHLHVIRLVILLKDRLCVSRLLPLLLSLQYFLRPNGLDTLPIVTDSIEQPMFILKPVDFSLILIDQLLVILFLKQFSLHRTDYLLKRAELALEKRVNVLALLRSSRLLEKGGEVLVKVDGSAFTKPVREVVIVAQKDHQFHLLFGTPVLVLEDGLPLDLPFLVLADGQRVHVALLLQLSVAFRARRFSQRLFHFIRHYYITIIKEGIDKAINSL